MIKFTRKYESKLRDKINCLEKYLGNSLEEKIENHNELFNKCLYNQKQPIEHNWAKKKIQPIKYPQYYNSELEV